MDCLCMVPKKYQCLYLVHWAASPSSTARMIAALLALLRTLYYIPLVLLHSLTHSSGHGGDGLDRKFKRAYRPEDMEHLLSRDWLNRGWIYQEIILSCNPVIVCGNKSISWDSFIRGIEYLLFAEASLAHIHGLPTGSAYRRVKHPELVTKLINRGLTSLDPEHLAVMTNDPEYMPAPIPLQIYTDDPFRVPKQCMTWRAIFLTWMNLNRPIQWHDKEKRRSIKVKTWKSHTSGSSFHLYQLWSSQRLHLVWRIAIWVIFLTLLACLSVFIALKKNVELIIYMSLGAMFGGFAIFAGCATRGWGLVRLFLTVGEFTSRGSKSTSAVSLSVYKALRERNVLDPKDQSYAFYGDLEALGVDLTPPDYTKSVGSIYADLLKDLLKFGWTLNLLLIAGSPGFEDSPTWTPNWHHATSSDWLDDGYVYEDEGMTTTPNSSSMYTFDEEGNLSIWGRWRGSMLACLEPLHEIGNIERIQSDTKLFTVHLQNIRSLLHTIAAFKARSRLVGKDEVLSNGVFEILHARIKTRTNSGDKESFHAWFAIMLDMLSASNDIDEQLTICHTKLAADPLAIRYYTEICSLIANKRTLFVTSTGAIGTASRYVASGDQLYVVPRVTMPLVLRGKNDTKRQLISPAFVYGMMAGEKEYGGEDEEIKLSATSPQCVTRALMDREGDIIDMNGPLYCTETSLSVHKDKPKARSNSPDVNCSFLISAELVTTSPGESSCVVLGNERQKVERALSEYRHKLLADAALSDDDL